MTGIRDFIIPAYFVLLPMKVKLSGQTCKYSSVLLYGSTQSKPMMILQEPHHPAILIRYLDVITM